MRLPGHWAESGSELLGTLLVILRDCAGLYTCVPKMCPQPADKRSSFGCLFFSHPLSRSSKQLCALYENGRELLARSSANDIVDLSLRKTTAVR